MKDLNGYICKHCSKQWGNWSFDSYRETTVCPNCLPFEEMRTVLKKLSKEQLIDMIIRSHSNG